MSYIHEALKKAQVERDRARGSDMGVPVPRQRKSFLNKRKVLFSAALLMLLLIAFAGVAWWELNDKRHTTRTHHKGGASEPQRMTTKKDRAAAPKEARLMDPPKEKRSYVLPEGSPRATASGAAAAPKSFREKNIIEGYQKARALHHDGRLPDAAKWYEKVIAMDPGHVEALNNRGVLYLLDKNYASARACFLKAIRLKPDYVDPYYNLACVSAADGRLEEGLRYLKKAISMNPDVRNWVQEDSDLIPLRAASGFNEILGK